jgi:hypothetical protein
MKTYKVRVFYSGYQDVYIKAKNKEELKNSIDELETNNVNIEFDFFEELEN